MCNFLKLDTDTLKNMCIKDENRSMLDKSEGLGRWKRYRSALFARPDNEPAIRRGMSAETEPPPLLDEVEDAVRSLPDHKAPGVHGIPAELIKSSPDGFRLLRKLVAKIWRLRINHRPALLRRHSNCN